jgi:hypothetical protein
MEKEIVIKSIERGKISEATEMMIEIKEYEDMKVQIEQLQAELDKRRWIPADEPPAAFASSPKDSDWNKKYYTLDDSAEIPEIKTAGEIWLDEDSEVEFYMEIILPVKE